MRITILAILFVFTLSPFHAEARRRGGGRNHGQQNNGRQQASGGMVIQEATPAQLEASRNAQLFIDGQPADDAMLEQLGQQIDAHLRKKNFPVVNGYRHPYLCEKAKEYLKFFAHHLPDGHGAPGHPLFMMNGRKIAPDNINNYQENSGMSGTGSDGSSGSASTNVWMTSEGWIASPGHRENLMGRWQNYCHMIAQAKNGKYYSIGLYANGNLPIPAATQNQGAAPQAPAVNQNQGGFFPPSAPGAAVRPGVPALPSMPAVGQPRAGTPSVGPTVPTLPSIPQKVTGPTLPSIPPR